MARRRQSGDIEPERVEPREISESAFARLLALHEQEIQAARRMTEDDGYSDFFVEGSGPPWHEAFYDFVTPKRRTPRGVTPMRMAFVDRRRQPDDGYSDFFVEGSGPPWHEAFADAVLPVDKLAGNPRARAQSLSKLSVMQAFKRMRERTLFERSTTQR